MKFKSTMFAFLGLNLWNAPFPGENACLSRSPFYEAQSAADFSIEDLKPVVQTCFLKSGAPFLITTLRTLGQWRLIVVPGSSKTRFMHNSCLKCDASLPMSAENPYLRQLERLNQSTGSANQGLRFGESEGVILSADLCPTQKSLDRRVFQALIDREDIPKPIPFTLAVSGRWLLNHTEDLKWLLTLEQQGKFAWIWANHSFTHPYKRGAKDAENFLALPMVNLEKEVLETEKVMISHGITPSIFFRFPGLISTPELHVQLKQLGLLPLGASAWLAKGQKVNPGSIVLIHANGNEPKGVQEFLELSKKGKFVHPREIEFKDLEEIPAVGLGPVQIF